MRAARLTGWAAAAVLVLGGHGAAALWAMHAGPRPLPPLGQPIFVDLAPPPPAPDFSVPESGLALSGPLTGLPMPPPDVHLPALPPLPPLPETKADVAPAQLDLPPIAPLPAFDAAALLPPTMSAARPLPRPKPPKPQPEPAREASRKSAKANSTPQPQKTASPPAGIRAAASKPSNRAAAQASGAGKAAGAKAEANWRASASAAVARHMQRGRYSTRGPVSATISLTVNGTGRITAARVSSGAGASLDATLTRQIRRLGSLPAPPGGKSLSAVVPVKITQ